MSDTTELDRAEAVIKRQMDMVESYKNRQDDLVLGLGQILKRPEDAKDLIEALLARDLKQAKERVYNRTFALDIALRALRLVVGQGNAAGAASPEDALAQIKALVPEAFE